MPKKTAVAIDTSQDSRIQVIFFLANIFGQEPTLEFLQKLADSSLQKNFQELGIEYKDKLWQKPLDKVLFELETEYTSLFLGPSKHISLHESVQRGEGRLWGDHTVAVNKLYQDNGYKVADSFKEMPDHLSAELQFGGFLMQEEKAALAKKQTQQVKKIHAAQKELIEKHLAKWLPDLVAQIKEQAKYKYYKAFAELLDLFMAGALADIIE